MKLSRQMREVLSACMRGARSWHDGPWRADPGEAIVKNLVYHRVRQGEKQAGREAVRNARLSGKSPTVSVAKSAVAGTG